MHGVDPVRGEAFAKRLDARDPPADARFKAKPPFHFVGERKDLVAMLGKKRLIRRHHMLPVPESFLDQLAGDRLWMAASPLHLHP